MNAKHIQNNENCSEEVYKYSDEACISIKIFNFTYQEKQCHFNETSSAKQTKLPVLSIPLGLLCGFTNSEGNYIYIYLAIKPLEMKMLTSGFGLANLS